VALLDTLIGVLGGAVLGVIGYIAVQVDACKISLHKMEGRIIHLEVMRDQEHRQWTGGRNRRQGDR
jgi:hypothetical protein